MPFGGMLSSKAGGRSSSVAASRRSVYISPTALLVRGGDCLCIVSLPTSLIKLSSSQSLSDFFVCSCIFFLLNSFLSL